MRFAQAYPLILLFAGTALIAAVQVATGKIQAWRSSRSSSNAFTPAPAAPLGNPPDHG